MKKCNSCGGEFNPKDKKVTNKDYCSYCANSEGNLKSYKDILETMVDYIKNDHNEISAKNRKSTAQKWLSSEPAWKDKFLTKEVVVENIRRENIKDIPIMNKKKKYDCNVCMYYMTDQDGVKTHKSKKEWFKNMNSKYKCCGKILYFNGEPVGYAQFAPRKEFSRLSDNSNENSSPDEWFLSCLAIKKEYQGRGLGKMLLQKVIEHLQQKGIESLQASGTLGKDASNISSGYWELYKQFGFKKISQEGNFITGRLALS